MLFTGKHERQLDDKGRLALPAAYRADLGERCYLVFGRDQCIDVIRADDFEAMARQIMEQVERGEASRQVRRALSSSATPVTVDRQGRIKVDEPLREYAGLVPEQKVIVAGNFDRIELWSPENFALVQDTGTSELAGR